LPDGLSAAIARHVPVLLSITQALNRASTQIEHCMNAAPTIFTPCWSCGAPTAAAHFCASCGKIQPLPRDTDHFAFFDLPRKLWLDMAALEARYHDLSWKLHPDNFVRAGQYERELSLDRSSQLNDAYRTLREPLARVEYLLSLLGARKEGATKKQAPPELLEEVFELNESLEELRMARRAGASNGEEGSGLVARLSAEQHRFATMLRELDEELMRAAREWDAALDAGAADDSRRPVLARMNEILDRRSYIRNLVSSVQQELAEA
jgi:molecular chaperone HscB